MFPDVSKVFFSPWVCLSFSIMYMLCGYVLVAIRGSSLHPRGTLSFAFCGAGGGKWR
jgi:hypothetical protein